MHFVRAVAAFAPVLMISDGHIYKEVFYDHLQVIANWHNLPARRSEHREMPPSISLPANYENYAYTSSHAADVCAL